MMRRALSELLAASLRWVARGQGILCALLRFEEPFRVHEHLRGAAHLRLRLVATFHRCAGRLPVRALSSSVASLACGIESPVAHLRSRRVALSSA
jgi:hypothetical protein